MKFIHLVPLILVSQLTVSQQNSQIYFNQFDEIVGSYSGDLNTGQRFEDVYPTNSKMEFRYLESPKSFIGQVSYNTQAYYKSPLKYDLLADQLLYENKNTINNSAIILDKELVSTFTIHDRQFVKLPETASKFSYYKNGYFEVIMESNFLNLYVKHEKFARRKIGDKSIYYIYLKESTIVLEYKSEYYEINTRNDLMKILPDREEDIKTFYTTYKNLESQNKIEFVHQLLISLRVSK